MSGFSYRHLKTLPEDLHKATYQMLCTLWPTQHIPEFWKQRWLVPLPKTTELNNIEDLRPICLLEIFRKLWTTFSHTAFALPGKPMTCLTHRNMDSAPSMVPTAPHSCW
jgi:hypothetical protein